MTFINQIISSVLVPVFMCPFLPFIHIAKIFNQPKELISLSANNIGSESDPIYLTAHRGITAVAPENSLPAYEKSVELGFYSAECDIRLTKDGHWVLLHNGDVNGRFCQMGAVEDMTLEEVRQLRFKNGSNFWAYENLGMPTLEEYLDVFTGSSTRPQIEIKSENYDQLHTILEVVEAKGLTEQSIIISFDLEQLKAIRALNKDIELWYLIDKIDEKNIAEAKALGNTWLSPNLAANDTQSIQLAVDNGIGLSFWTVNTIEDAKMLYDMGVRYMETDKLCY
jgi:glycerophosphoryl diester phosphodiesterase